MTPLQATASSRGEVERMVQICSLWGTVTGHRDEAESEEVQICRCKAIFMKQLMKL